MINYNDITEIAILSPFRAQTANIRRHIGKNEYITEENRNLLAIDTIDKMRPIGQFAGYDMAISPINTGDVAISNL